MKERKLINLIALLFIINHFLTIILIVVLTKQSYFNNPTFKVALAIISPVFVTLTTIIMRYIIKHKNKIDTSEKKLSFLFSFAAIFIPFIFLFFLYYILINQALHADSIENFTTYLGLVETFFGVYTGYIIKSLFDPAADPFEQPKKGK